MADTFTKMSKFTGIKRFDMEKYVTDLDRDVRNLFEEKTLNLQEAKRYAYTVSVTQG